MRIVERVERNGPDKPHHWNPPPFKLAISAAILVVGLVIAGLLAPTRPLMLASFGLAWSALLRSCCSAERSRSRRDAAEASTTTR